MDGWLAGWSDWPRNNVTSPAICLSLSFPRNLSVSVDGCMVAVKAGSGWGSAKRLSIQLVFYSAVVKKEVLLLIPTAVKKSIKKG